MQNSQQWIDHILPKLFEAEDRYLGTMISELNRANCVAKNQKFQGFIHMGKRCIPPEFTWAASRLAKSPLPSLHLSLWDQASEMVKHQTRVDLDRSQIKQILFQQLHQCNDVQEVRDSLPECLIPLVPELQRIKRFVQDPLFLVRSNAHSVYQYEKILPKIEYYAMSRMIY